MSRPPQLADRAALARNRARALRAGPALFLHEHAADEIEERLSEVNRQFTAPAIVTGFGDFWSRRRPDARIVPDDDTLDLAEGAHDLVVHAMAMHWAADPVGQLVQCRRALRPDGLMMAVLLGGRTLHELRAALAAAEARVCDGLSPRVAPMGELRDMGGLLQRAGLALPVADSVPLTASYGDLTALMHDLRAMGEANALAARHRAPPPRALCAEAAREYAAHHAGPDGRLRASFELVFLTGWAPAPDQPQPLRPGSAATRLAEALGTEETRLPDKAPHRRD